MTDPIPAEYDGRVVPYLLIDGASDAIEFYKKAFDAEELFRMPMPDGTVAHAEIRIGGAVVMIGDVPDIEGHGEPKRLGGSPVLIFRYVADVDASVAQAQAAGATVIRPPEDQFYGDRSATLMDPWGHLWSMHTHMRDVSPAEMSAAMDAMAAGEPGSQ